MISFTSKWKKNKKVTFLKVKKIIPLVVLLKNAIQMDKKGVKILLSAIEKSQKENIGNWWSSYMNFISKEDFEYAKEHLTMFDPVMIGHNDIFKRIEISLTKIDKKNVINAFLYSLSTRKLEYRSFLSSYCIGRVLPMHNFVSSPTPNPSYCSVCGLNQKMFEKTIDFNITNFFKYKHGACFDRADHILFDLEHFQNIPKVTPTAEDYKIINDLKLIIESSKPKDTVEDLKKRFGLAIKSNDIERLGIVEILGVCGVLHDSIHLGYADNYVTYPERVHRSIKNDDVGYPARWWKGEYGIDLPKWQYWFGD